MVEIIITTIIIIIIIIIIIMAYTAEFHSGSSSAGVVHLTYSRKGHQHQGDSPTLFLVLWVLYSPPYWVSSLGDLRLMA